MKTTVLQIPMSKDLRISAEKASEKLGFSSLQEVVRIFLNQFSNGIVKVSINQEFPSENVTYLSKSAEKRYKKAIADIKSGNTTKTRNLRELLGILHK